MDTQRAIRKIRRFYQQNRRMPTHREICTLFGYRTKASSAFLVNKLVREKMVEKDESGKLIPDTLFPSLQVLGRIRAGFPTDTQQQHVDTLSISRYVVEHPESSYLLEVSGDSMIDAGIHPGDLVVVERERAVRDGDIVVAEIDGEYTVKYMRKKGAAVSLVPANPSYPSLYPKKELRIIGVVVSVIRKYHERKRV